jgi:hypothetical protein
MSWHHNGKWLLDLGWMIILLMLFNHFWRQRQRLVDAQFWLIAKGRVTQCEWAIIGRSIWPKIEYTYRVCEKECVGQYLFLDTAHNNPNSPYARRIAFKVAVAFKENKEIDVYYNPNHPEQSALDITIPTKLNMILILICTAIAFHLVVIGRHFFIYFGGI